MGSLWSKPGSYYELKQEEREIIDDVDALLINGFDWSVYNFSEFCSGNVQNTVFDVLSNST